MPGTKHLAIVGLLLCCAAQAQDSRATALRALLRSTPLLPVERVKLSDRMPNAAALGIVSSVATDRNGVIYILQRGDKADPVIALNQEGRVLRSWGKGM